MIHVIIHMSCGTREMQGQGHVQSPPGFPSEFSPELQQKSA